MNEFEQQLIDKISEGIHSLELKVTRELGEVRGVISSMAKENEGQHKELRGIVEDNIEINTQRLNKHSQEIDEHSKEIAKFQEWKAQYEKHAAHRLVIWQSISAVGSVIVAYLLSKFF